MDRRPPESRAFAATDQALFEFVDWIRVHLQNLGSPADDRVVLAEIVLVEAFTNICRHGAAGQRDLTVKVEIVAEIDRVTVTLEDDGPLFDPTSAPRREREGDEPHGMGLLMMAELPSVVAYERRNERNRLTVTFKKEG